jgi:hypothetical protein
VKPIDIALESGPKRVFASALEWPGWSRGGSDEDSALQSLIDYGPRYAKAIASAKLGFNSPKNVSALRVVERLEGNATTDFGVPGAASAADKNPLTEKELARLEAVQKACWRTFDTVAKAAGSSSLRKGPRGGGRDVSKMIKHVLEGDWSYLTQLGGRFKAQSNNLTTEMKLMRSAFHDALVSRVRGELPDKGPRGGKRWGARYAVRRSAWHALDHAWEIEDRRQ